MKIINIHQDFSAFTAALKETIVSLLCWLFGYPLTFFIKRDPNLTLVIIRSGNVFADNSKYYFVYANDIISPDERIVLLTSGRRLQAQITEAGGQAILHPTIRSLFLLLRCGTLVTDIIVSGYYPLIHNAQFVQIWHGAPLKHIELDVHRRRLVDGNSLTRLILSIQKIIIGRYPVYDIVVATSQKFIENAFQSSFKARRFIATGYPRNDILFGMPEPRSIAGRLARINVDQQAMDTAKQAKCEGMTLCLYAPTFRKSLSNPFDTVINLTGLSEFATQNNILFVLKLHPVMHGCHKFNQYSNILEYDSNGDVYPLMALCDILITDYSSIYFDYLLLDRPILFFAYDLENYLEEDRNMYFDYESMTPGAKCRSQQELEQHLKTIISKGLKDDFSVARKTIKIFTHDHVDNQSCRRLIQESSYKAKSRKS